MYNQPVLTLGWEERLSFLKYKVLPFLLIAGIALQTLNPVYASSYRVGAGDELSIGFPLVGDLRDLSSLTGNGLSLQIIGDTVYWRHQVMVAPDGFITLPSLPPIHVIGRTLEEIQDFIALRMKSPFQNLPPSVVLTRPNSTAFYVWGEVKQPGRFVLERPTTLLEAVGTAGGATDRARLKRVLLLRPGEPTLAFDLSRKSLEKNGLPDITLQSADTVWIPKKLTPDSAFTYLLLAAITAATGVYIAAKQ